MKKFRGKLNNDTKISYLTQNGGQIFYYNEIHVPIVDPVLSGNLLNLKTFQNRGREDRLSLTRISGIAIPQWTDFAIATLGHPVIFLFLFSRKLMIQA